MDVSSWSLWSWPMWQWQGWAAVGSVATLAAVGVALGLFIVERNDRKAAEEEANKLREAARTDATLYQARRVHAWVRVAQDVGYEINVVNTSDAPIFDVRITVIGWTADGEHEDRSMHGFPVVLPGSETTRLNLAVWVRERLGPESDLNVSVLSFEFRDAASVSWTRDKFGRLRGPRAEVVEPVEPPELPDHG